MYYFLIFGEKFFLMSDQSFVIAFPLLPDSEMLPASESIISYLSKRNIISDQLSSCVLSKENFGYAPGIKFIEATVFEEERVDIINCNFAAFSSKLQVNGLEVLMDRKCVANASGEWQFIQCPSCSEMCPYLEEFSVVLDHWLAKTGNELLTCNVCNDASPVTHWGFSNDMVLGNLILQFWNWPEISKELCEDLSQLIGYEARTISCRF